MNTICNFIFLRNKNYYLYVTSSPCDITGNLKNILIHPHIFLKYQKQKQIREYFTTAECISNYVLNFL